ncbi:protein FAR1-RELATED SEQUENCE 9 isoform X2 [Rosa chinensis]|uniref:protein FAR1-RELATED SEQUENCE 9 isoform X2 n=1 Tax=Rosa chinensis TaxID=74649 RepID=UPI000D087786|nr:protein FAR1-RELATED SEQUENCE 9 isoform X2 [Rosa chinensis]
MKRDGGDCWRRWRTKAGGRKMKYLKQGMGRVCSITLSANKMKIKQWQKQLSKFFQVHSIGYALGIFLRMLERELVVTLQILSSRNNSSLHSCSTETEFQPSWDDMISRYNLGGNTWLEKLYSLREKWCPVFSLDTFSAKIRSTQRSESTNNVFHQISTHTMELIKFVHHCEKKIEEMRLAELEDDYRCKNGTPRPQVWSRMLRRAAKVYTIKMFQLFETEFVGCMGVRLKEAFKRDEAHSYEAIEDGKQSVHKIQYNSISFDISCSCKSFESLGILCRHALKVSDINNVTVLPTQYILKRWTREAKKGIVVSNNISGGTSENIKSARLLRLSELMHEGNSVYDIASLSCSGTKIVKELLVKAMKRLEKDKETQDMLENLNKVGNQSNL